MMQQSPEAEEVILTLRQLATNSSPNDDPASIHIRAGALFARLKALNRDANAAARHGPDPPPSPNLLYEKRHLEREIEKCRQFAYVSISSLPQKLIRKMCCQTDHQLTLNRLGFELVERQRLDRKVKELAQEKEELLKSSKSQAATTESVKTQIETLLKTASEIGKKVEELVPAITNIPHETPMPG
ncbi:hypothetical protein F5888DRAFT_1798593 [Russula emetica]|nr:hypothetical protein F5888DRAFT_1798593 [Russula emetica]